MPEERWKRILSLAGLGAKEPSLEVPSITPPPEEERPTPSPEEPSEEGWFNRIMRHTPWVVVGIDVWRGTRTGALREEYLKNYPELKPYQIEELPEFQEERARIRQAPVGKPAPLPTPEEFREYEEMPWYQQLLYEAPFWGITAATPGAMQIKAALNAKYPVMATRPLWARVALQSIRPGVKIEDVQGKIIVAIAKKISAARINWAFHRSAEWQHLMKQGIKPSSAVEQRLRTAFLYELQGNPQTAANIRTEIYWAFPKYRPDFHAPVPQGMELMLWSGGGEALLPMNPEKWALLNISQRVNLVKSLGLPGAIASKAWGALTEAERATLTAPEAVRPPTEVVTPVTPEVTEPALGSAEQEIVRRKLMRGEQVSQEEEMTLSPFDSAGAKAMAEHGFEVPEGFVVQISGYNKDGTLSVRVIAPSTTGMVNPIGFDLKIGEPFVAQYERALVAMEELSRKAVEAAKRGKQKPFTGVAPVTPEVTAERDIGEIVSDLNLIREERIHTKAVTTKGALVRHQDLGWTGKVITPAKQLGGMGMSGKVLVEHEFEGRLVQRWYDSLDLRSGAVKDITEIIEGKPIPPFPKAEIGMPEAVKAPAVKPPVAKPISETAKLEARRIEIKELLATPAADLPKGVKKIELRQELKGVDKGLVPVEKKLRQQIMATVKSRGLPERGSKGYRQIFKDKGGDRYLTQIGLENLRKVQEAVKGARPVSIGSKKVITEKIEQAIIQAKQRFITEGKMTEADYDAVKRLLKLPTDKYVSRELFITNRQGLNLIRAMRRKTSMGYAELEQAIVELVDSLGQMKKLPEVITATSMKKPKIDKIFDQMSALTERTYRVERILLELNKYDENGIFLNVFYKPINAARDQELRDFNGGLEAINRLFKAQSVDFGKLMAETTEIVPGVVLSSSEKIGVYLATLNPDKLRHLTVGNKFSDELIDTVVSSLTDKERVIADWILKYYEKEGPAISLARIYTEAKPLDLVENYSPIRLKWDAFPELDYWQQISQQDSFKFLSEWASGRMPKGFLKARTHEAIQALDLDEISNFVGHLTAVSHYKAFAPVIADLQAIMANHAFKSALISKTNPATYQIMDKWLKQCAEIDPLKPASYGEKIVKTLRVNAVTAALGLNLVTSMLQFASFASGAAEIGSLPAMKGLFTVLRHPNEIRALIKEVSPQIYYRSFERELAEMARARGAGKLIAGKLSPREVFMVGVRMMDRLAVNSLWTGGYLDWLKKHPRDLAGAKEYTERGIRKLQPYFEIKDLAELWRSNEFMKTLTIFTNQLNQYQNYYRHDIFGKFMAGKIGIREVIRRIWWAFVIPALIVGAVRRSRPAQNAKEVLLDFAGLGVGTIPIAGAWIVSGIKGFTSSGLITTEVLIELQKITGHLAKEQYDKLWKDIPVAAGYLKGFPINQPKRTLEALVRIVSGESDDWLELIWGQWAREKAMTPGDEAKQTAKELTTQESGLGQFDVETGTAFNTGKLSSSYHKQFRRGDEWLIDPKLITEENGFSPLARFWVETDWKIRYFDDLSPEDQKAELHADPWLHAYLYFWGKRWADMPEDIQPLVETLVKEYDVPRNTVRGLQEIPVKPEVPSPQPLQPQAETPEKPPQRWERILQEAGLE